MLSLCEIRYPHIKTIIELGGEDSKLIFLDKNSTAAKDFSMNSVCAAGTGSFLDQQAERLNLSIEDLSELSLKSKKPPRIAGRCSVFAKSDMIHVQQIATPVEDIVAVLCFAVARNFKGPIAKGRSLELPVCFQGGVAANKGMVRAFKEVFGIDDLTSSVHGTRAVITDLQYVEIGRDRDTSLNYYSNQRIAGVALWKQAFSTTEMSRLWNSGVPLDPRTMYAHNLLGYWPLVKDVYDYSGQGNHLTVVSAPIWTNDPAIMPNPGRFRWRPQWIGASGGGDVQVTPRSCNFSRWLC